MRNAHSWHLPQLAAITVGCLLLSATWPLAAEDRLPTPDTPAHTAAAHADSLAAAVQAHILLGRQDTLGAMAAAYRALPEFRGGSWPDVPEVRQVLLSAYAASHLVAAYDRNATAAALSRDGKRIAMVLRDGIEVRSLDPDARLAFLKLPARPSDPADAENPIRLLDIATDGRHILAANLHDYWVWPLDGSGSVRSGNCGDSPDIDAARFVGAGDRILVKCGPDLKLLDAADLHAVLELHDINAFDASRDGRLIATDKEVRAIRDGRVVLALPSNDDTASSVAFAPDGRSLAVARYRTITIWDVADATAKGPQVTIEVQSALGISSVIYASDGKSLITTSSGEIRVWDATNGDLASVWSDNRTNQSAELLGPDRAYVSADGRWLLTASNWQDGMYTTRSTLWSLAHPDALPIRITRGETELAAAAFTQGPAPIFATVDKFSTRGGVFIWSADSGLLLHRWGEHIAGSAELLPAAKGANDIIVKRSEDGALLRCGFDTFTCARAPASALAALDTVIATPKGKAMVTLDGQALVAKLLQDGTIVWRRELAGAGSGGSDFKVLDGGAYVLWISGLETPHPTLIVLRAADGATARSFDNASAITPLSGRLVVIATRPRGFALVDLDTGKSTPLDLPGDGLGAVALARDGARAAIITSREDTTAESRTVQFINVIATADGHVQHSGRIDAAEGRRTVESVAFSPDGQAILLGSQIVDAKSGRGLATLAAETDVPPFSSRYSPDGRLIFALYDAGLAHSTSLRIFSAADGMLLQTFLTSPSLILQFSQDGKAFVVQDQDGLGVYLVPSPDAIAARARRLLESAGLLAQH